MVLQCVAGFYGAQPSGFCVIGSTASEAVSPGLFCQLILLIVLCGAPVGGGACGSLFDAFQQAIAIIGMLNLESVGVGDIFLSICAVVVGCGDYVVSIVDSGGGALWAFFCVVTVALFAELYATFCPFDRFQQCSVINPFCFDGFAGQGGFNALFYSTLCVILGSNGSCTCGSDGDLQLPACTTGACCALGVLGTCNDSTFFRISAFARLTAKAVISKVSTDT